MLQIVRVEEALPDGVEALRDAARAEGFAHMDRLIDEWRGGAQRFNRAGEALFAAYWDGALAGVGGLTREPSDPDAAILRARRLYVHPTRRKNGVARALAGALLQEALQHASCVTVNAGGACADAFWRAMGFAPCAERPGLTHIFRFEGAAP